MPSPYARTQVTWTRTALVRRYRLQQRFKCVCVFANSVYVRSHPDALSKKALGDEKSEDFLTHSFFKKAGISDEKSEDKKARIKSDF